jgi:diaminopimelate epimerase
MAGESLAFRTVAGTVRAEILGARVKLQMPDPFSIEMSYPLDVERETFEVSSLTAGVPHVIHIVNSEEELASFDVVRFGRAIRHHDRFAPAGTNANFIAITGTKSFTIRTYERGVEDETLACGTGAIAAALAANRLGLVEPPVAVKTLSRETLTIHFRPSGEGFTDVFLEGDARIIYEGRLSREAGDFVVGVSAR